MRRIVCLVSIPAVLGIALAVVLVVNLSGCGGGEQKETGTVVEVTDQMLQDAKASDAFYMEQEKQRSRGKRAGGN